MAMRIKFVLIVCFLSSSVLGQEIKKRYLLSGVDDSVSYSVTIKEDSINGIALFSSQDYTLKVFGVKDILMTTVHSGSFLEIQFKIPGGSGVRVRRKVLLCMSQGKIYKAMDILSEVTSRITEVYDKVADSLKLFDEKEDYLVTLSIKQTKDRHFKAVLFESKKVESKYNSSQNDSFERSYQLDFDPGGYFFYSSMKRLNKHYKVYSSKDNKAVQKFISEEVPCIQLYEKTYLLIDNDWYLDNGNDSLSCL